MKKIQMIQPMPGTQFQQYYVPQQQMVYSGHLAGSTLRQVNPGSTVYHIPKGTLEPKTYGTQNLQTSRILLPAKSYINMQGHPTSVQVINASNFNQMPQGQIISAQAPGSMYSQPQSQILGFHRLPNGFVWAARSDNPQSSFIIRTPQPNIYVQQAPSQITQLSQVPQMHTPVSIQASFQRSLPMSFPNVGQVGQTITTRTILPSTTQSVAACSSIPSTIPPNMATTTLSSVIPNQSLYQQPNMYSASPTSSQVNQYPQSFISNQQHFSQDNPSIVNNTEFVNRNVNTSMESPSSNLVFQSVGAQPYSQVHHSTVSVPNNSVNQSGGSVSQHSIVNNAEFANQNVNTSMASPSTNLVFQSVGGQPYSQVDHSTVSVPNNSVNQSGGSVSQNSMVNKAEYVTQNVNSTMESPSTNLVFQAVGEQLYSQVNPSAVPVLNNAANQSDDSVLQKSMVDKTEFVHPNVNKSMESSLNNLVFQSVGEQSYSQVNHFSKPVPNNTVSQSEDSVSQNSMVDKTEFVNQNVNESMESPSKNLIFQSEGAVAGNSVIETFESDTSNPTNQVLGYSPNNIVNKVLGSVTRNAINQVVRYATSNSLNQSVSNNLASQSHGCCLHEYLESERPDISNSVNQVIGSTVNDSINQVVGPASSNSVSPDPCISAGNSANTSLGSESINSVNQAAGPSISYTAKQGQESPGNNLVASATNSFCPTEPQTNDTDEQHSVSEKSLETSSPSPGNPSEESQVSHCSSTSVLSSTKEDYSRKPLTVPPKVALKAQHTSEVLIPPSPLTKGYRLKVINYEEPEPKPVPDEVPSSSTAMDIPTSLVEFATTTAPTSSTVQSYSEKPCVETYSYTVVSPSSSGSGNDSLDGSSALNAGTDFYPIIKLKRLKPQDPLGKPDLTEKRPQKAIVKPQVAASVPDTFVQEKSQLSPESLKSVSSRTSSDSLPIKKRKLPAEMENIPDSSTQFFGSILQMPDSSTQFFGGISQISAHHEQAQNNTVVLSHTSTSTISKKKKRGRPRKSKFTFINPPFPKKLADCTQVKKPDPQTTKQSEQDIYVVNTQEIRRSARQKKAKIEVIQLEDDNVDSDYTPNSAVKSKTKSHKSSLSKELRQLNDSTYKIFKSKDKKIKKNSKEENETVTPKSTPIQDNIVNAPTSSDKKINWCTGDSQAETSESPSKHDLKQSMEGMSVQEVYDFVASFPDCLEYAEKFKSHEIDGQALFLLTLDHLLTGFSMKLGHAVKFFEHLNSNKDI
ncbi:hypothetical protein JTE90_022181 [Oedothorax gibbosus]|uniref:SAM domain-containing protein n=1 Tax=Oedothorax gibbosus TaxID=931172 RepID=A0AAV6VQS2_9ARAC|nr:hypothetical protein JTE90_022181 [Oedothorax gibbosus]